MKDTSDKDGMIHCMGCGPPRGFGWGGGRSKLPVEGILKPVHGKITVFSLPHACLAAGLFGTVRKTTPVNVLILRERAEKKWKRSVEKFFADAKAIGIDEEAANIKAGELGGAVIGWDGNSEPCEPPEKRLFGICPDLVTTLAVLSRRVTDIFISWRPGDFTWDPLFGSTFEIDEEFCEAPNLRSRPWSQYKWELSAEE